MAFHVLFQNVAIGRDDEKEGKGSGTGLGLMAALPQVLCTMFFAGGLNLFSEVPAEYCHKIFVGNFFPFKNFL